MRLAIQMAVNSSPVIHPSTPIFANLHHSYALLRDDQNPTLNHLGNLPLLRREPFVEFFLSGRNVQGFQVLMLQ